MKLLRFSQVGVDVADQLVQVLVPGVSCLVVKVHSHGEQDVVGGVVLVLVANVVDEVSSFGLDVVVVHHLAVHQRLVVAQQVPTEIV